MRWIYISSLILAIFVCVGTHRVDARPVSVGSPELARFQRLAAEDGLPISGVASLFQDSRGFIWVGSFIGLSRFDGYRFANYTSDQGDPRTISATSVSSIVEARSGKIWVGTTDGLNEYDEQTDGFKRYDFDPTNPNGLPDGYIRCIYEDSFGSLWVGTNVGGLSRFEQESQTFTTFHFPTVGSNMVGALSEDKQGNFWIGTGDGLYKFDRGTGTAERIDGVPDKQTSGTVSVISVDPTGILWLGTSSGLYSFDPVSGRSKAYRSVSNDSKSLTDDWVRTIHQTASGTMWVGTNKGLDRYIRETDDFVSYRHDPSDPYSLINGEILAVLEDANQQLWVGGTSGLNKFNQKTTRFHSFQHDPDDENSVSANEILSIYEDRQNTLWIGTRAGGQHGKLNRFDLESGRFEVAAELGDVLIFSSYEDRSGKLWFGAYDAVYSLEPGAKKPERYQLLSDATSRGNGRPLGLTTIGITEDDGGNILLATVGEGMLVLDRLTGKLTRFELKVVSRDRASNNRVYSIVEDRQRQLWVGTAEGLERVDATRQNHTVYRHDPGNPKTISANDIGTVFEDSTGILWIGTSSGGLNRFEPTSDSFIRFTRDEGLPSNDVFGIVEDDQRNLWLATDRGLARFNIASESFRTYNVTDGVPNNPFDNKTLFRNQKGEIYFGGQNGFVQFDPREFTDSTMKPPVYLSDIRVLEQPLKTGLNFAFLKEIELSWRDYVVSFDFAALDFTDPRKLQYQWKLDGFDPDWINGGTRRTATYSNLPGGDYVLKVKATNVDGLWTDESVNLKIHVQPPFFRTVWFWALVALAVGFLILLAYRYRIGQLRSIGEAKTRFTQQLITSQEAERKRIAAELHDGLGQSLVIIKNRAMLGLNKRDDKERVVKELSDISDSASQALDEVREITNNLRPQLLDRLGLTKAIIAMLKKYAGVIDIKSDIDPIDGLFDENAEISIYRIVQESVNNTIKHSNASTAKVKIKRIESRIIVEIKDNGKGFDPQSLPTEQRSFGLTGLRERAQLLGGELVIDSHIGVGTKVSVTFPTGG